MKTKILWTTAFLLLSHSITAAATDREIIIGIGAGYGLSIEDWLSHKTYLSRNVIYFEEHGSLKNAFFFNIQYLLNRNFGLQAEYSLQNAAYFCHLDWYGYILSMSDTQGSYIPINHFEEPYTEPLGLHSILASALFTYGKRNPDVRLTPYISIGGGLYFLSGSSEKILDRWRLGPGSSGTTMKASLGFKYRLSERLNLNSRLSIQVLRRRWGDINKQIDPSPSYQFDYYIYDTYGKIVRSQGALIRSYSFLSLDIGLEFNLRKRKK